MQVLVLVQIINITEKSSVVLPPCRAPAHQPRTRFPKLVRGLVQHSLTRRLVPSLNGPTASHLPNTRHAPAHPPTHPPGMRLSCRALDHPWRTDPSTAHSPSTHAALRLALGAIDAVFAEVIGHRRARRSAATPPSETARSAS